MECCHGALISKCRKRRRVHVSLQVVYTMVLHCAQGGAARYGTHPWHWYVTQGLPTVLGPGIAPLALFGMYSAAGLRVSEGMDRAITGSERMRNMAARLQQTELSLAWIATWVVAIYSTQPHKEFRFVLCTLPMFAVYAGKAMAIIENDEINGSNQQLSLSGTVLAVSEKASVADAKASVQNRSRATRRRMETGQTDANEPKHTTRSPSHSPHRQQGRAAARGKQQQRRQMRARWLYAWLVLLNGPLAYYFGRWHQAAPVSLVCIRV